MSDYVDLSGRSVRKGRKKKLELKPPCMCDTENLQDLASQAVDGCWIYYCKSCDQFVKLKKRRE